MREPIADGAVVRIPSEWGSRLLEALMQLRMRGPASISERPLAYRDADFAALRRSEYSRLDDGDHAYLDYTGAGVYAASQIDADHRRLLGNVLGNPHSENPTSLESTARMERARRRVLAFLHADPSVYDVVFTTNASAALRLVGESFPFASGSRYVLTTDNHNSVNGIRSFAARRGGEVYHVPLRDELRAADPEPWLRGACAGRPHLFAFPAQANFSGVRHPLEWIARAKSHGFYRGMPAERARICREALGHACTPERFATCIGGPAGAVRASLGIPAIARDIDRLAGALERYRGYSHR